MPPGRRPGTLPKSAGRDGAVWNRIRANVLAASDICGICGHPGSNDVDHIIPKDVAPDLVEEPSNLQPAHGASSRCMTCDPLKGRNCNREKSTNPQATLLVCTEDWLG